MVNDPPLVWVLCGPKVGDNSQMVALASVLEADHGCRVEFKPLAFYWYELLLHMLPRPTLVGLQQLARSALAAPWPDLVVTAGRRNELVARWIRQQHPAARLVHLGRPWSKPSRFDLVVTTPQYKLVECSNILLNTLPLRQVDRDVLNRAGHRWKTEFYDLPQPYVVLLVGGNSGAYVFTENLAKELAEATNSLVRNLRGTLLLSTSARTPQDFLTCLLEHVVVPGHQYHWHEAAAENPYLGYLALGDCFIVTAESVSMVSEAVAMQKPVLLFDIPSAHAAHWWLTPSNYRWKPLTQRLTMTLAPKRFRRDIRRIHERLVALGLASWLGDDSQLQIPAQQRLRATSCSDDRSPHEPSDELPDELHDTAERVARLLLQRS